MRPSLCLFIFAVLFCLSSGFALAAGAWKPIGPEGGDVRSLAMDPSDPSHLYMGTLSGWVYESHDGGGHWQQLAEIAGRDDLVLDSILVDPRRPSTLLVGAWLLGKADGGLYRSTDSGHTWSLIPGMMGQSIRALARSESQPSTIVAGTLAGVFCSYDSGETWRRISPPENVEIHEVESIAIDPKDPNIIYAGTWHLPWKTLDGGATWQNIKEGLIDDSDVFSIVVDSGAPSTVYLSACSGIYRSLDGGEEFLKVQGIPSTARRTRVLRLDPADHSIVYAGTTEGLYKTVDAGGTWVRMTAPDVIVNDINIDPRSPQHVVMATDRSGVLLSEDGGVSFHDANRGVYQRQISALAIDPKDPNKIYAGVVNDKSYGGVFASQDGGATWQQRSLGLAGRDVYSLAVLPNGDLLAGTNQGIALWTDNGPWGAAGKTMVMVQKTLPPLHKPSRTASQSARQKASQIRNRKTHHAQQTTKTLTVAEASEITARVNSLSVTGPTWYAATAAGMYRSTDAGAMWEGGPVLDERDFRIVSSHNNFVFAADVNRLFVSADGGETWVQGQLPDELSQITGQAVSPDGTLWLSGPQGIWTSRDQAQSFQRIGPLPMNNISSLTWDAGLQRVLATSYASNLVLSFTEPESKWNYWAAGWPLRMAVSHGGKMMGASLFHGVVLDEEGTSPGGQRGVY
jgi:photosystem II stability/assembly factor-like uncharacterized protein